MVTMTRHYKVLFLVRSGASSVHMILFLSKYELSISIILTFHSEAIINPL